MILGRLHPSVLLLAAGLAVPLGGCGTIEPDADSFGSLSLHLTDTPDGRIERAVVTISRIELGGAGEPIVLRQTPATVDLVALSNATAPLVENFVLPAGRYPDLRLVIEGAYIVVSDSNGGMHLYSTPGYSQVPLGQPVDGLLKTPSWDASGFKVFVARGGIEVDADIEPRTLLVDFDVHETFGREAGTSGSWVMRPVLRATELKLTSTIDVQVTPVDDAVGDALLTQGEIRVQLVDALGNVEGELPLRDDDADGVLGASFKLVDPEEGPFGVRIAGIAGTALTAEPDAHLSFEVEPGASRSVTFRVSATETP